MHIYKSLIMNKFLRILIILQLTTLLSSAQEIARPQIWGIAKMTFLVSSFDEARDFYGRFLGFDEAFSYNSGLGRVISFKVNDRQFLEFVEDREAKEKKRLISVSIETEDVESMRQYLNSRGIKVPGRSAIDGAGNEIFTVDDPSGNCIEFIDLKENGMHRQSKGRYLSEQRISKRIHHAGLYAAKIMDNDPFYSEALQLKEIVRYPEDKKFPPTILYLGFGDCTENIEHYSPNDINVNHPCFLVDDMQETIYTLKERSINEPIGKPAIGKGRRWILNLWNSDKTRVEFTEAYTVR